MRDGGNQRGESVRPRSAAGCEILERRVMLCAAHGKGFVDTSASEILAPSAPDFFSPAAATSASTTSAFGASLLPDMVPLASQSKGYIYGWTLDANEIPGRLLLRLSTAIGNGGQGPMELRGGTVNPDGTQNVLQRVSEEGGTSHDRLAGTFTYHASHHHIHFDDFAAYRLRQVTAGNGVGDILTAGEKVSFCLLDTDHYAPTLPSSPSGRVYATCTEVRQGISAGWADVYTKDLPDQWIDVTDVPSGHYWLEVVADPENHLQESDETNNTVRIAIDLVRPAFAATSNTPSDTLLFGPVASLDVMFNGPVDTSTFSPTEDILSFTGPGGQDLRDLITSATFTDPHTLHVIFPARSAPGSYQLLLSSQIRSAGGSVALDQDGDGIAGEAIDDRYTASFTLADAIGPDGFGYFARPVPMVNVPLTFGDAGVNAIISNSDDASVALDLGSNTFNFYGTSYTGSSTVFVSSNALITFGSGGASGSLATNGSLTTTPTQRSIAVLWDDWTVDHNNDDRVLYKLDDANNDGIIDRLIIQWTGVSHYASNSEDTTTFETILKLNTGTTPGGILFNYPDITSSDAYSKGISATVGIKDAATQGTRRLLIAQDTAGALDDGRAIEIAYGASAVAGRSLFYNNSKFDGDDPAATLADAAAIDTTKHALLPGQNASLANYSNFSGGITGMLLDFAGMPPGPLGPSDFGIKVGTSASPQNWTAGLAPTVTVLPGIGGANTARVALTWPAGALQNEWVQVTVQANPRTNLAAADVFYFGNLIGDTNGDAITNAADYFGVRDHLRSYDNPGPATWSWDINRDGLTDGADLLLVRATAGAQSAALQMITAPPSGLLAGDGGVKTSQPTPAGTTPSAQSTTGTRTPATQRRLFMRARQSRSALS